jgi:hypothetical protein
LGGRARGTQSLQIGLGSVQQPESQVKYNQGSWHKFHLGIIRFLHGFVLKDKLEVPSQSGAWREASL